MSANVLWDHWQHHLFLFMNAILVFSSHKHDQLQHKLFTI